MLLHKEKDLFCEIIETAAVGENKLLIAEYGLEPFDMTLQSLERTFADKVFALCDYYMNKRIKRNSRHIYDIYMLYPKPEKSGSLKKLIH